MSYHASDEDVQRLFKIATDVKENSYCPYSHFRVGAAVLCSDGSIFEGTNCENAAYPSGLCAERTAIFHANAKGHRDFRTILITSDINDFCSPCGACRQVIVEFGNIEVIMAKANGEMKRCHILDLLPMAFTPADLTK